jgi:hypothetical protein
MPWTNQKPTPTKRKPPIKNTEWGKIDACQDWCDIDRLHGEFLKEGERLEVMWPNGSIEQITISIADHSYYVNDMGVPYRIPVRKAHADTTHNGAQAIIPLFGLNVRRV